jgi:hypothetical protein
MLSNVRRFPVLVEATCGSNVDKGVAALKAIVGAAGIAVGISAGGGIGAGAGGSTGIGVGAGGNAGLEVGAGGSTGIEIGAGGNAGLEVGTGGSTGLGPGIGVGGSAGLCTGVIVNADASGAIAKGADDTRDVDVDVDEDDVGVALPGDVVPLEPDEPATAGESSSSNNLSNELEELDVDPLGAVAASNVFHLGFIFCAFFAYSFLPFFPLGGAGTPLYVAVPGVESGGSPSLARQRGARRPKSGTAECIGSSFSPPQWMAGSRGKSWSVSGTPSRRALTPACAMSSALSAARCVGVLFSGVKRGINMGSAGTGSRKLVPVVGCCQGSKASAPATLKLRRDWVSEGN